MTPKRLSLSRPTLELAAGAALISFSPVMVKLADVAPTAAGFYRVLFGGGVLVGIVVFGRHGWRAGRRSTTLASAAGILLAVDLAVWHRSIQFVGPGLATILGNFQVFVLAAFGIVFLRERPAPRLLVAVPVAITGLFLIFGLRWDQVGADYKVGVVLGGFTALFYAALVLTLRAAQRESDAGSAVETMTVLSVSAALLLGISVVVEGESFAIPNRESWAALITYALVAQVLGWVLISKALPNVPASRAGLILLLQPCLAFVWDVVLFDRDTVTTDVVGVTLALAAIYLGTAGRTGASGQRQTAT